MIKEINTTVYEASDDVIFKNKYRCEEYEEAGFKFGIKGRDFLVKALEYKNEDYDDYSCELLKFLKSFPDDQLWFVVRDIYDSVRLMDVMPFALEPENEEDNHQTYQNQMEDLISEKDNPF